MQKKSLINTLKKKPNLATVPAKNEGTSTRKAKVSVGDRKSMPKFEKVSLSDFSC
jgi:hypothetical protein